MKSQIKKDFIGFFISLALVFSIQKIFDFETALLFIISIGVWNLAKIKRRLKNHDE